MILRPCLHCVSKKGCERKKAIHAQCRGTGLTTGSFRCDKRFEPFPPGTRISYQFDGAGEMQYSYYEPLGNANLEIAGTVMHRHRTGKLICWMDEMPTEGRWIVKLWPDLVTILDEPLKKVCSECGRPEDKENREEWDCPMCDRGLTWEEENKRYAEDLW